MTLSESDWGHGHSVLLTTPYVTTLCIRAPQCTYLSNLDISIRIQTLSDVSIRSLACLFRFNMYKIKLLFATILLPPKPSPLPITVKAPSSIQSSCLEVILDTHTILDQNWQMISSQHVKALIIYNLGNQNITSQTNHPWNRCLIGTSVWFSACSSARRWIGSYTPLPRVCGRSLRKQPSPPNLINKNELLKLRMLELWPSRDCRRSPELKKLLQHSNSQGLNSLTQVFPGQRIKLFPLPFVCFFNFLEVGKMTKWQTVKRSLKITEKYGHSKFLRKKANHSPMTYW